jgi:ribokinase
MTGRVVVVGSLNVDLVTGVERLPRPGETVLASRSTRRYAGGKGGNQAVAAAAAGARVVMLGAVGDDEPGRAYAARLASHGIEARLTVCPDRPTGTAYITVGEDGANVIVVDPGANAALPAPEIAFDPGDVLLVQLEIPVGIVAQVVGQAHAQGARVVVNAAPYAALPPEVAGVADPVVVNEPEAALLADSGVVPRSLLVTFGAAGAQWDAERVDAVAVPNGQVRDTTGAGDAFCGALAARLAAGDPPRAAMRAAARAGAAAVRRPGAQPNPQL